MANRIPSNPNSAKSPTPGTILSKEQNESGNRDINLHTNDQIKDRAHHVLERYYWNKEQKRICKEYLNESMKNVEGGPARHLLAQVNAVPGVRPATMLKLQHHMDELRRHVRHEEKAAAIATAWKASRRVNSKYCL
jgi:hypothetical protein